MVHTTCLVCLVSTVSDCHKNALGRPSPSNGHITKLEQSTFLQISMGYTQVCQQAANQMPDNYFKNHPKTLNCMTWM